MIHVAFAADAVYLPHAAAMLGSVRKHSTLLTAHLLQDATVPSEELARFAQFCTRIGIVLRCHRVSEGRVADLPAMGRIPRVMWYRLFLPELLPELDRVLYVDCDVLALDDVTPLWTTALEGKSIGAVSNVFEKGLEERAAQLGLSRPADYFNSGVLLMDLRAWRERGHTLKILELARSRTLVWPDQDALNMAFAGEWHPLHPRWNCQNSLFYFRQARKVFGATALAEAKARPGLLHFEGGLLAKPWHYLCKHPYAGEYFHHRGQTPWPSQPLEGRTTLNRLLKPLPTPWIIAALRLEERVKRRLGN